MCTYMYIHIYIYVCVFVCVCVYTYRHRLWIGFVKRALLKCAFNLCKCYSFMHDHAHTPSLSCTISLFLLCPLSCSLCLLSSFSTPLSRACAFLPSHTRTLTHTHTHAHTHMHTHTCTHHTHYTLRTQTPLFTGTFQMSNISFSSPLLFPLARAFSLTGTQAHAALTHFAIQTHTLKRIHTHALKRSAHGGRTDTLFQILLFRSTSCGPFRFGAN